jgi:hypothetical protein
MRTRTKLLLISLLVVSGLTSCGVLQTNPEPELEEQFWLYESITFEIAPIGTSVMPSVGALETFRERLHENRICRDDQVRFIVHSVKTPTPIHLWNGNAVRAYERVNRTLLDMRPGDEHLIVFVGYINGPWMEGADIRFLGGLQYSPSAFVIFKDGAGDREAGVLLHEFGHLIGMVKNEARDNHDDEHKHHCANKRCAMFWRTPRKGPVDFDYYCKRYIRQKILLRMKDM